MARIRVRYFGMLRQLAGKSYETMTMEDSASVSKLIGALTERNGPKFKDFVFDARGKLREGFAFAINGESVTSSKLSKMKCKDVSEFVILPPISGGK